MLYRRFRMSRHAATSARSAQASALVAHHLSHQLASFLAPILRILDQRLDRRLVGTFLATLIAIVQWRNRPHGLLLSELGAYLLTPEQAPAGTKRLSNLLRSPKWSASLIETFLWQGAAARLSDLRAAVQPALALWDGAHLEKPQSRPAQRLCPL